MDIRDLHIPQPTGLFMEPLNTEPGNDVWPTTVTGLMDLDEDGLYMKYVQVVVFSHRYGAGIVAMMLRSDDSGQALAAVADTPDWESVLQLPEFPAATGSTMVQALIHLREKMRHVAFTTTWLSKLHRATELLAKHSDYNREADKITQIFEG